MGRPASPHPTRLEHRILKILWEQSPLPVRDIRDRLAEGGRDIAHTSVITTPNTMVRKRYLQRTRQKNAFLFRPLVGQAEIAERVVVDIVEQVFDGSASALMLSLFNCSEIDAQELDDLRSLIQRKRREQAR